MDTLASKTFAELLAYPSISKIQNANTYIRNGFTLIELLVTIAIVGIVLAIAAPQLASFVEQQRMARLADTVVSGFNLSRLEAIKYNQKVCLAMTAGSAWAISFNRRPQTCACNDTSASCAGANATAQAAQLVFQLKSTDTKSIILPQPPAPGDSNTLNNSFMDPVRGVWTFSDFTSSAKFFDLSSSNRQLRFNVSIFGKILVCSPISSTAVPGYDAC